MAKPKGQFAIPAVHRYSSGFIRSVCVWHAGAKIKPYRFKYITHNSYGFVGREYRRDGTHVRDIPYAFSHRIQYIKVSPATVEILKGLAITG